jgi:hypothetical protein
MSNMIKFRNRQNLPNQTLGIGISIQRGICGYCWMVSTKKGVLEFETGLNCRIYTEVGLPRSNHDMSTFEKYHKERLASHHSLGAMTQRLSETQRKPQTPVFQVSNALPNLRSFQGPCLMLSNVRPKISRESLALMSVRTIFHQFGLHGDTVVRLVRGSSASLLDVPVVAL